MLENLYQTFGILGSLIVSLLVFVFIIFWIAGIAGISDSTHRNARTWQLVASVLFPPYPVVWLVYDMVRQYKMMHLE